MKYTPISKKLTGKIIVIGLATFLLSLLCSYFAFVPMLIEKAEKNADKTNEEIISLINNTVSFVESSTENLAVAVSQIDDIENYFDDPTEQNKNVAMIMLSNLISREGLIRSVIVEPENKPLLETVNKTKEEDYAITETPWYKQLHDSPYNRGFSAVYSVGVSNTNYKSTAYVRSFYQNNRWNSFVVFVSLNSMINNIRTSAEGNLDDLALLDPEGNVYFSMGSGTLDEQDIQDIITSDAMNTKKETTRGIIYKKTSISNRFALVSTISRASIYKSLIPYFTGIVVVLISVLVLTLSAITRTLHSFTLPITMLSKNMRIAAKGNLECPVQIERNDEIGSLGESFNIMLTDLKHSLDLLAEQEKQRQQAKFSLLVSQIDPHFIYNTINSINYLARKGRCEDVIAVNSALISILQDRLRVNDIQITDTVEREIYVTNQYIAIQRYMFYGDVDIEWDVNEDIMQRQIPKNLVQPLVENALFHGLIDEESGELHGKIEIKIWEEELCIKIRVSDNGVGMDEEKLLQVQNERYNEDDRGKKIGISNIRGRLFYLFGERDCISIESQLGKGTAITLTAYCK